MVWLAMVLSLLLFRDTTEDVSLSGLVCPSVLILEVLSPFLTWISGVYISFCEFLLSSCVVNCAITFLFELGFVLSVPVFFVVQVSAF